ncbi:GNAT family N-acetyltransferase [Actinocorallia aurea]
MGEHEEVDGAADAGGLSVRELEQPEIFSGHISLLCRAPHPVKSIEARQSWWWWCEAATDSRHTYLGRVAFLYEPPAGRGFLEVRVRPSRRRRGHGTAIMNAVLPIAAGMGVSTPTMTARADDEATLALIGKFGGILAYQRGDRLEFLIG